MLDPAAYRQLLATRLRAARGDASLFSTEASGIGYRVVQRLERAGNVSVDLSTLYLLCLHYDTGLGGLLEPTDVDPGTWPTEDVPSLPDTLFYARCRLRDLRHRNEWGTRRLSSETSLDTIRPSWIFRIESGEVSTVDVIRLAQVMDVMALSVVDLLPPALRAPGIERALPNE